MEQSELLRYVAEVFDRLAIRYFVTGSVATVFYGEPRFTNDIDVVADVSSNQAAALCRQFPEADFYVSEEAVRQAISSQGQFNIIHPASGLKVDVIIPSRTDYDLGRFTRVVRVRQENESVVQFSSPEDVIIKKMEFYREGGSEKHLRDIAGVLKISGDRVDRGYIEEWAGRRGVSDIWRKILDSLGTS